MMKRSGPGGMHSLTARRARMGYVFVLPFAIGLLAIFLPAVIYSLIYSLCDENYSLHCSHDFGPDVNEKWAYVLTAALVTFYWVTLSMLGGLVGSLIPFDTTGIDFALTALFIVIFLDQLKAGTSKLPAVVSIVASLLCLVLLGPDNFLLPALSVSVAALVLLRPRLEGKEAAQ